MSLAIIGLLYFFLAIYSPGAGLYVRAEQLPDKPDKFVEFTSLELENYPYIKKAVLSPGTEIKIPYENEQSMESLNKFGQIMESNGTDNLEVEDKYYVIHSYWAD